MAQQLSSLNAPAAKSFLVFMIALCGALMFPLSGLALDFPSSGYVPIIIDPVDPSIEPCRDIIEVGYQQDGTNSYFSVTVNCDNVGFNNQRYSLFLDINSDGVNEYLIWMDNPQVVDLYSWDGSSWQDTDSPTADFSDPNLNPDNTIFLGVASAELGLTGQGAEAVGASTGRAKDKLVADCNTPDCQASGDTTGSGEVGTGFLGISQDTLCAQTATTVTASLTDVRVSFVTFEWFDPSDTLRHNDALVAVASASASSTFSPPDSEGFWKVTVTYFDSGVNPLPDNISPESDDIFINVQSPTAVPGPDATICDGDAVTLGGTPTAFGGSGPYTISWGPATGLDDASAENPQASPTVDTTYTLTVTDINGCSTSAEVTVLVAANPSAHAGAPTAVCLGDSYTMGASPAASGGDGNYSYSWSPAGSLDDPSLPNPVATPGVTTTYQLEVTDGNGCKGYDTVEVTANACGSTLYRSESPLFDPSFTAETAGFVSGGNFPEEYSDLQAGSPDLVFYRVSDSVSTLTVTVDAGRVVISF